MSKVDHDLLASYAASAVQEFEEGSSSDFSPAEIWEGMTGRKLAEEWLACVRSESWLPSYVTVRLLAPYMQDAIEARRAELQEEEDD
jgi:hypothetical protein